MQAKLKVQNLRYASLSPAERLVNVYKDYQQVLYTCSFGASSVFLLDLMHEAGLRPKVHFIDTGYHFEETLAYREALIRRYGLEVVTLKPDPDFHEQTRRSQLWKSHPDTCCAVNKREPIARIKEGYQVWVSGLMSWQTSHRQKLEIFSEQDGIIKFCPVLDVSPQALRRYLREQGLPLHPLQKKGYFSIGCTHCTRPGRGRQGRWVQKKDKMECGLHV